MDIIKDAFKKVKEDVLSLKEEMNEIKKEISNINLKLITILSDKKDKKTLKFTSKSVEDASTHPFDTSSTSTHPSDASTHPSTDNLSFNSLKTENFNISTGNKGVSTDRQQTDNRQTTLRHINLIEKKSSEETSKILDSLDNLKKTIQRRFKQITEQEFLVFSTLYQLEESNKYDFIDYQILSEKLGLTESSVRDYISRLIKKEIPIEKEKINNKKIKLSISKNLKKIAPLSALLTLRSI